MYRYKYAGGTKCFEDIFAHCIEQNNILQAKPNKYPVLGWCELKMLNTYSVHTTTQ